MISPRSSADRKSCFFVSKRSKQTQTFDLIDSKTGRLTDLFKVNSLVRVGHLVGDKGVEEEKAGGECSDGGVALPC